jgi:thiamine-phosphate pyrophosphorylase
MTAVSPRTRPAAFYPIGPDADWVERLVPLGIETVQLRMKGVDDGVLRRQSQRALDLCRAAGVQLIINDAWRIALDIGADDIHLGQDDLAAADLGAIRSGGLRVGISTHDEQELALALDAGADYIALGPVYETKLKAMRFAPQGLARVSDWKARIGALPLVAIGGLTPARARAVLDAGADSLAVVTDILTHGDPEARVREWLATTRT